MRAPLAGLGTIWEHQDLPTDRRRQASAMWVRSTRRVVRGVLVAVTLVDDGTRNCSCGVHFRIILLAATHGADGSHRSLLRVECICLLHLDYTRVRHPVKREESDFIFFLHNGYIQYFHLAVSHLRIRLRGDRRYCVGYFG